MVALDLLRNSLSRDVPGFAGDFYFICNEFKTSDLVFPFILSCLCAEPVVLLLPMIVR
jgi:hypothetical protein